MRKWGIVALLLFAMGAAAMGYAIWQDGTQLSEPSPPREGWAPCEDNNDC